MPESNEKNENAPDSDPLKDQSPVDRSDDASAANESEESSQPEAENGNESLAGHWHARILGTRSRRVTVAAMVVGLILACLIVARLRSPVSELGSTELALSDAVRFEEQVQRVIDGEQTRIYVVDFEVDSDMLGRLPIAQLLQFKAQAMAEKAAAPPEERETEKKTDFATPAWEEYPRIEDVLIDQGVVRDEDIELLSQLPDLEHLRLRLSPISDEGIKPLLRCQSLWLLNLPHCRLTKAGIQSLTRLSNLKQLRIGSPNLSNDCCRAIRQLENLRGLHLIGVAVTDEGLKLLCELPHLESLYLDDSAVTQSGWEWVFRNHPQLHVHVNEQHHDRDPQAHSHAKE